MSRRAEIKTFKEEFYLESGRTITNPTIAYETYGKMNDDKSNVILICHALTGSSHAGSYEGDEGKESVGWWDFMVGSGKAFDTDRYFIVCSNILGSCYGTTGPASIDPLTNKPYGLSFPVVTIKDMVKLQKKLLEQLGIDKIFAVAGGSMGGMQALEWAVTFPDSVTASIVISSTGRLTPMAISFNAIARNAIKADKNYNNGDYYGKTLPRDGLAIARMAGHITYLSDIAFHKKFGRRIASQDSIYDFNSSFEVENYLVYNGYKFTERFDPNSYLYVLKAMDIFDIAYGYASYDDALKCIKSKILLIDYSTDFLFPKYQIDEIYDIMKSINIDVKREHIDSDFGHDAFLIENSEQAIAVKKFLDEVQR